MTTRSIEFALGYATAAHGRQKYGDKPYMYHVQAVVTAATVPPGSENLNFEHVLGGLWHTAATVAALHDVIEDTHITKEMIADVFGDEVAELTDLVTNQYWQDGGKKTRVALKIMTLARVRTNPIAVFVKLCDRYCNTLEGQKNDKYRKEMPAFTEMLYRPGEFDELWDAIRNNLKEQS